MDNNSVSVVIPLGNAFNGKAMPEREEALQFSIKNFYLKHPGIEIILVCQNYEPPAIDGVKILRIKSPVFNKGWCINCGARAASGKYLCIAESDMYSIIPHLYGVTGFMKNKNLKWCFAWSALIYTTEQQRCYTIQNIPLTGEFFVVSPKRGSSEGGLVMFDRSFFLSIGGCNEWFEELGGPDNELARRAQEATGTYEKYGHVVTHLWHPKCREKKRPSRLRNKELYFSTVRHTSQFNTFLSYQSFGDLSGPLISKKTFRQAWEEHWRGK